MHFFSLLLHADVLLTHLVSSLGLWSYLLLFMVIFLERGCILTPFLPGDSLLFAAGALAANHTVHLLPLMLILTVACYAGTWCNYWVGYHCGEYLYRKNPRWLNPVHRQRAHTFFEHYGLSALVICSFIPVIRTFMPFVAGVARMSRLKYNLLSLCSAILWIIGVLGISYMVGNTKIGQHYFSWMVLAMIMIPSLIPGIHYVWQRWGASDK